MKIVKSIIIMALLALLPINAFAYDIKVDGIYYNIISLEDLTCAVTSGEEKYAGEVDIPAKVTYNGKSLDVIEIGESAFSDCEDLVNVKISNSVTSICASAFRNTNIKNVEIPNSVKSISEYAFADCMGLTHISIPNSVTELDYNVFSGCSNLKEMVIEDGSEVLNLPSVGIKGRIGWLCPNAEIVYLGRDLNCSDLLYLSGSTPFGSNLQKFTIGKLVTKIFAMAFEGSKITEVTIPDNVTSIEPRAFYGCKNLRSITIPNSVTLIGGSAFYRCKNLCDVVIGDGLCEIASDVFSNCSSLTNVSFGKSIKTIGRMAFRDCSNLTNLVIPNSVTFIDEYAFDGCSLLESVRIAGSVQEIGNYAFDNCANLKELVFEDGDEILLLGNSEDKHSIYMYGLFEKCPIETVYIGRNLNYQYKPFGITPLKEVTMGNAVDKVYDEMFSFYTNLAKVSIGSSVASIGLDAFEGCSSLLTIYSYNPIPPSGADNAGFTTKQYLDAEVYVPKGSLEKYQAADGWKIFFNIYEMDTPTGLDNIQTADNVIEIARYSIDGKRLSAPQKGLNIVVMSDGSKRKVLVK